MSFSHYAAIVVNKKKPTLCEQCVEQQQDLDVDKSPFMSKIRLGK